MQNAMIIGILNVAKSIFIGLIKATIPKTKRMFVMFEPNILPSANPLSFLNVATMLDTNSGADVPIGIKVRPIIATGKEKNAAIVWPDCTIKKDPITKDIIAKGIVMYG